MRKVLGVNFDGTDSIFGEHRNHLFQSCIAAAAIETSSIFVKFGVSVQGRMKTGIWEAIEDEYIFSISFVELPPNALLLIQD